MGAGPLDDLLSLLKRLLGVYNKLFGYHQRSKKDCHLPDTHFNEQIQEVLRRHCVINQNAQSQLMSPGEFLTFIDCRSTNTAFWERNYPDADVLRFGYFVFAPVLRGKVDVEEFFDVTLPNIPFTMNSFPDLLTFVFTKSQADFGPTGFSKLCEMLTNFEQLLPGTLDKSERTALECRNLNRALLLYTACCVVRKNQSTKNEVVETKDDG
ncbi:unnamed protein product [Strongylus vulgaris]|uniref:Uncharacterized protein n=1 Tax=Strongylus vulgaris TaxID=40348 RepID=A0A3P7J119_STRVU|nr:unnamed protein product [Strongylus vulgaris]